MKKYIIHIIIVLFSLYPAIAFTFPEDSLKYDCEVWFTSEVLQIGYIHFYADAFPQPADIYNWDFGDGTTGTGEDIEHYFDPVLGDSFIVTLVGTLYDTISQDSCVAEYQEEVWVYNGGSDCVNFFGFSTEDNISFTFYGEAIPEAFFYLWDFGDGQTATGPEVEHTFDPILYDSVEVSLYTLAFDPVFNDTCEAWSSIVIPIGDSYECTAFFTYTENAADPFTFSFFDESTGMNLNRIWSFGDSTFSAEQNPVHTFPFPGDYLVCLTVWNDSLFCTDTYCVVVTVEGEPLVAGFTYELDSLSQTQNKFLFTDITTGNPDSWLWDFGDGTTSGEMNPVHIFNESGYYNVCLTVSRNISGWIVYDSYCEVVITPEYFDFGGVTYLGEFPMNNSGVTSDTGVAYLYRKVGNDAVAIDTNLFYQYGYYWFAGVLQGDYIVKLKLTEGSLHYDDYLPSYYVNSYSWKEATSIALTDSSSYAFNIFLPEIQETEVGTGSISGYIKTTGDCLEGDLSGITVILFNQNNTVIGFAETGSEGLWTFNNLPIGEYSLYAEATGLSTVKVDTSLSEASSQLNDVELTVDCENSVGYPQYFETGFYVSDVYPNPIRDKFNIEVDVDHNSEISVTVYSVTGQKLIEQKNRVQSGSNIITINSAFLPRGSYLLSVSSNKTKSFVYRKFVK